MALTRAAENIAQGGQALEIAEMVVNLENAEIESQAGSIHDENTQATEQQEIIQILKWIGFDKDTDRNSIVEEAFETYDDLKQLVEKDIHTLSVGFSSRTENNGRINFGLRRTKRVVAFVHWVQDFERVSLAPSVAGLTKMSFLTALQVATTRDSVRKLMISQADAKSKAASPGPLVNEAMYEDWEPKFLNYLSCILGVRGVPIVYVVRDNVQPTRTGTFADFIEQTIMQAPLNGTAYLADRVTVQHALITFTTGQLSATWIKSLAKFRDGRRSMEALKNHFAGEGNTTRKIARAEQLKISLHYKNESSLKFEVFLTRCQEMYTIYEQNEETMPMEAQIRFLFSKINNAGLDPVIAALKVDIMTKPKGSVTYTMVANHLATAISALAENKTRGRSISAVTTNGPSKIHDENGKIKTGTYSDWYDLSPQEKKLVGQERSKLGVRPPRRGGGNRNSNQNGNGNARQPFQKQNKDLKAQNQKYKRQIKALKRKSDVSEDEDAEKDTEDDAGNHFGGRNSKKGKKE